MSRNHSQRWWLAYRWLLIVTSIAGTLAMCSGLASALPRGAGLPVDGYRVVKVYPHDPQAFTQGLLFADGKLWEGTGMAGQSSLREVELESGRVTKQVDLDPVYFGEGITRHGSELIQLTWKNKTAFIYDADTLRFLRTARYEGQGWGITSDGKVLFLSDGSSQLRVIDPATWKVLRRFQVMAGKSAVDKLNELEYVDGEIWANIWYADQIARINPETGSVLGYIDLTGIYEHSRPAISASRNKEMVLNGIAVDSETGRIFVTGKNWPRLYEIERVGK
jgi:glutaminyl-peptide cyclotransferase